MINLGGVASGLERLQCPLRIAGVVAIGSGDVDVAAEAQKNDLDGLLAVPSDRASELRDLGGSGEPGPGRRLRRPVGPRSTGNLRRWFPTQAGWPPGVSPSAVCARSTRWRGHDRNRVPRECTRLPTRVKSAAPGRPQRSTRC
jgi:hypothetical protein